MALGLDGLHGVLSRTRAARGQVLDRAVQKVCEHISVTVPHTRVLGATASLGHDVLLPEHLQHNTWRHVLSETGTRAQQLMDEKD